MLAVTPQLISAVHHCCQHILLLTPTSLVYCNTFCRAASKSSAARMRELEQQLVQQQEASARKLRLLECKLKVGCGQVVGKVALKQRQREEAQFVAE